MELLHPRCAGIDISKRDAKTDSAGSATASCAPWTDPSRPFPNKGASPDRHDRSHYRRHVRSYSVDRPPSR
jgi:hypothetical protein